MIPPWHTRLATAGCACGAIGNLMAFAILGRNPMSLLAALVCAAAAVACWMAWR